MGSYENAKNWKQKNPEKWRAIVKKSQQKRRANMTPAERVEFNRRARTRPFKLATPRPDKCEVCGNSGRICLDHCHATMKFRGWLCEPCNTALGRVKDNPDTLRKLAEYLERGTTD